MTAVTRYLPVLGEVWRLALPVIASNLLVSLVNVVDVFMAGRLGPLALAAVGLANGVRVLVLVGVMSVTFGATTLAAQAFGAKDEALLSRVTRQSLSLVVLLSLLLGGVGWLVTEPLLHALSGGEAVDAQVAEMAAGYLRLLFAGTVLLGLNLTINSLLQGVGDTLTPLYITAAANVLNVVFNYLFMFGPGPLPALGVTGAALGTLAARAAASGVGLYVFYRRHGPIQLLPGSYRPDWALYRNILSVGVPSGLQGVVRTGAQLLLLGIISATAAGTYGVAAQAIGLQLESLAFMPDLAVSVAATSLVGQSLGAWRPDEARLRGNTAIFLGVLVMSALALPMFALAPGLIRLFDPSAHPTVIAAGTSYLRVNALFLPLLTVAMVTNGTLRGAGDTRPGLVGTVIGRGLLVVPLAHLLALRLGFGVTGVWWALCAGTVVQAAWVWGRWRGGRWLRVALRQSRLYRVHLQELPEPVQTRFLNKVRTPVMQLGAVERVTPEGVLYTLGEGELTVRFTRGNFQLSGSLPQPEAARAGLVPTPAYD